MTGDITSVPSPEEGQSARGVFAKAYCIYIHKEREQVPVSRPDTMDAWVTRTHRFTTEIIFSERING